MAFSSLRWICTFRRSSDFETYQRKWFGVYFQSVYISKACMCVVVGILTIHTRSLKHSILTLVESSENRAGSCLHVFDPATRVYVFSDLRSQHIFMNRVTSDIIILKTEKRRAMILSNKDHELNINYFQSYIFF